MLVALLFRFMLQLFFRNSLTRFKNTEKNTFHLDVHLNGKALETAIAFFLCFYLQRNEANEMTFRA